MSQVGLRGGKPQVARVTATTTPQTFVFAAATSYLKIRSLDNAAQVFLDEAQVSLGQNYITIPAPSATAPGGEWSGPAWVLSIVFQTSSGTADLEVVGFLRLA